MTDSNKVIKVFSLNSEGILVEGLADEWYNVLNDDNSYKFGELMLVDGQVVKYY